MCLAHTFRWPLLILQLRPSYSHTPVHTYLSTQCTSHSKHNLILMLTDNMQCAEYTVGIRIYKVIMAIRHQSLFNTNIKSVLLHACETWKTNNQITRRLQTFVNTCLKLIMNIKWFDRITNEDLRRITQQETI
jgi:hypothetical protein